MITSKREIKSGYFEAEEDRAATYQKKGQGGGEKADRLDVAAAEEGKGLSEETKRVAKLL